MRKASLLILSILLLLITGNVYAEGTGYGIFIGDTEFNANTLTIPGNKGGTATYDPQTKTLTLKDFKHEGSLREELCGPTTDAYNAILIKNGDVKIVVEGENKISFPDLDVIREKHRAPEFEALLISKYTYITGIEIQNGLDESDFEISDEEFENTAYRKEKADELYALLPETIIGGTGTIDFELGTANGRSAIYGMTKLIFQDGVKINVYNSEAANNYIDNTYADAIYGIGVKIDNANFNIEIKYGTIHGILYDYKFEMNDGIFDFYAFGYLSHGISVNDYKGNLTSEISEAVINGGKVNISFNVDHEGGIYADNLIINGGEINITDTKEELVKSSSLVFNSSQETEEEIIGIETINLTINGGNLYINSTFYKMTLIEYYGDIKINNNKFIKHRYEIDLELQKLTAMPEELLNGVELRLESYTYKVIEGDNQKLNNESDNYYLIIDGNPDIFAKLSVDNEEFVKGTDYTLDGEKLIFSETGLNKIKQMPTTSHEISMVYGEGDNQKIVKATFSIENLGEPVPQTYDNLLKFSIISILSIIGLSFVFIKRKSFE